MCSEFVLFRWRIKGSLLAPVSCEDHLRYWSAVMLAKQHHRARIAASKSATKIALTWSDPIWADTLIRSTELMCHPSAGWQPSVGNLWQSAGQQEVRACPNNDTVGAARTRLRLLCGRVYNLVLIFMGINPWPSQFSGHFVQCAIYAIFV